MKNRLSLLGILLLAALLRFYRIRDYLVFLGDEGRDVLVVKRILVDHFYTLLGPVTSVGGMYLGPIYYYFMAPFLWFFHLDPLGPAVMIGLLSLSTIYLMYRYAQKYLDTTTGLIAALLYATSPLVIIYSRSSWNPNAVPFFAMLIIFCLTQAIHEKAIRWVFFVGLAFGIIIQLHYLALLFLGVFIGVFLYFRPSWRIKQLGVFFGGASLTFSPFILFELRHKFPNTYTIFRFVTHSGKDAPFSLGSFLTTAGEVLTRLFWKLVVVENLLLTKLAMFGAVVFIILFFLRKTRSDAQIRQALPVLLIWLIAGLIAYGLYTGAIYDYYFVPLFPLPFLLAGFILSKLFKMGVFTKVAAATLVLLLVLTHFLHSPHGQEANRLLNQTEIIARLALSLTDDRPYNFALISNGNSDHAYRYFFELWDKKPVTIQNQVVDSSRESVTDQLIVICESRDCQPLGNSLWEIAGFGRAEIVSQWDLYTVKVFKLIRFTS